MHQPRRNLLGIAVHREDRVADLQRGLGRVPVKVVDQASLRDPQDAVQGVNRQPERRGPGLKIEGIWSKHT